MPTHDRPDGAARLRAAGLRVTRPRLVVLDALERLGGHRSVDELGRAVAEAGEPLPLTTVYNVVEDLSTARVIMAADTGPGRALYEAAERGTTTSSAAPAAGCWTWTASWVSGRASPPPSRGRRWTRLP